MKQYAWRVIGMSFWLYALPSIAMQSIVCQKKSETTVFNNPIQKRLEPSAIKCGKNNVITIINLAQYEIVDYHTQEIIQKRSSMIGGHGSICFHPNKNIGFYWGAYGAVMLNLDTSDGNSFYPPTYAISGGCFSSKSSVLFMTDVKKIISYDYKAKAEFIIPLKRTMGLIFACPSQNNNFFICSDVKKKSIYKIEPNKKHIKEKKLFSLKDFIFDENTWAYSNVTQLLCLVHAGSRVLHVFNIQDRTSRMYQHGPYFLIANIMFHSNKKTLILLSENRKRIKYIDMSTFDKIHPLLTTKHTILGGRHIPEMLSKQKMTVSLDGQNLFITVGSTIFNICVPFIIAQQPYFEKYKQVCHLPLPLDIHKVLLWYLFAVRSKAYGDS